MRYTSVMINIQENIDLKEYSTMRLGGAARFFCEVKTMFDVKEAVQYADEHDLKAIMIGGGSNIIWSDAGYDGLVIHSLIKNFEVNESLQQVFVTVGSGENWDEIVEKTTAAGLSGLEYLSLIPGTAGGTPVQNVGAYGSDVSKTIVSVQAYDREKKDFVILSNSDCEFGYRTSRFKAKDRGRFFIFAVTYSLSKDPPTGPYYKVLENKLQEQGITNPTPQNIREAVIEIRKSKLPDPREYPNNGSFFANPIIPISQIRLIKDSYPDVAYWEINSTEAKISAAWLLETIGLKGYVEPNTGIKCWDHQPLVFVNDHAKQTSQLIAFRDAVTQKVKATFDITLHQEPEII